MSARPSLFAQAVARGMAVALVSIAVLLTGHAPAAAAVEDPDLDTFATYRFVVDVESNQVEVTIELAVTADKPNEETDGGTFQYFFEGAFLAIPSGVEGLEVRDNTGRTLSYNVDDSIEGLIDLEIDFWRNIFYRQTANVVVSFTLPGGEARGEGLTRVNPSYVGFEAWVDPRLEGVTVEVIAPEEFANRSTQWEWDRTAGEEGFSVFTALEADPELFWSVVSLTQEDKLVEREVEAAGQTFTIRHWPDDAVWSRFVAEQLEEGLPVLINRVGLEWPIEEELTIVESFSPYLEGYAGWYDPTRQEILIGDELDQHLVFHELSHVWLNEALFQERWITEGLADVFGAEVVERLTDERPTPEAVRPADDAALALNRWSDYNNNDDTESWAYAASWLVTEAIVEEVGIEVLAEVVEAAVDDHISYRGDGAPETVAGVDDWRRYLDLVENLSGDNDGSVADLFQTWAVPATDGDTLLAARAGARTRYQGLAANGAGWAPPLVVRQALTEWRFPDALRHIADANDILADRSLLETELAEVDGHTAADAEQAVGPGTASADIGSDVAPPAIPESLETAYEEAEDEAELVEAADLIDEAVVAATELRSADDGLQAATGLVQRIGRLGGGQQGKLDAAVAEFEDGNFDAAVDLTDQIDANLAGLTRQGYLRIGGTLALLVIVGFTHHVRSGRKQDAEELERHFSASSEHQTHDW